MNRTAVIPTPIEPEPETLVTQPLPRARFAELDVLRGFLLVWMTCTHLPTRFSAYSNQTIGYVSAAEGFIFLAAFLTGQVQRRAEMRYGAEVALRRLWRRARRIYFYHAVLVAIAFTLVAALAVYLDRMPLKNLLDFYLIHPMLAVPAAAALVYNPPLLDILPMYVVFTAGTPMVLRAARKVGWPMVMALGGGVWLLAQCGFRAWLYATANRHGFPMTVHQAGAFDLFAWQFLWILGLWLGTYSSPHAVRRIQMPRVVAVMSAMCAIGFLAFRHSPLDTLSTQGLLGTLVNKWELGGLRLVDLAAVAVLLVKFGGPLARSKWALPLGSLGRSSLQVFSVHVLVCLAVLGFSRAADPHFSWWQDVLILAAAFSSLFWAAHRAERRARREFSSRERRPASLRLDPSYAVARLNTR